MIRAILVATFAFTACAFAQGSSALNALKLLPKDAAKRLARIEARDGAPWPERWYFLVYDPATPLGLREFAVADGAVKASRTLSQFGDELKPEDVVGADVVKFDSDAVAALAGRFTMANGTRLGTINYEFGKYGENDAPAWRATVMNDKGDPLGVLIIIAKNGAVERHDGFDNNPLDAAVAVAEKTPIAVAPKPTLKPVAAPPTPPAPKSTPTTLLEKPFIVAKPTPRPSPPTRVVAPAAPTPQPNAIKRFGSSVKKLFGE